MHKSYSDAVGASRTYLLKEKEYIYSTTPYAIIIPYGVCQVQSGGVHIRKAQKVLWTAEDRTFMVDNEDNVEERVAGKEND